jgi:hypothetical protein
MIKIGRIPLGLRIFYHPASFILVAVATATASSSRLAGLIKSLATRLEDIVEMSSCYLIVEELADIISY